MTNDHLSILLALKNGQRILANSSIKCQETRAERQARVRKKKHKELENGAYSNWESYSAKWFK